MKSAITMTGLLMLTAVSMGMDYNPQMRLRRFAMLAIAEDRTNADAAILLLRNAGPNGLQALLDLQRNSDTTALKSDEVNPRLEAAINQVAAQHDAVTSRLYWYTDLDLAKRAAADQGKPILSLRLLGNLTDELSCANSRFFRSTLYANTQIGNLMREKFVLHWQSVRPAPRVTIDFGDGRKLEGTVTGNSIHYVLDASGQLIDALPGLNGPQSFARWLADAAQLAKEVRGSADTDRTDLLVEWHRNRLKMIDAMWQADCESLALRPTLSPADLDDAGWGQFASLHLGDAELDAASRAIIAAQNPPAAKAAFMAISKGRVEAPIVRLVRNLQQTISLDTVKNKYTLHRQIHQWIVDGQVGDNLDRFNERVYSELFLTPLTDPWLGLVPQNTYTGTTNAGLITTKAN